MLLTGVNAELTKNVYVTIPNVFKGFGKQMFVKNLKDLIQQTPAARPEITLIPSKPLMRLQIAPNIPTCILVQLNFSTRPLLRSHPEIYEGNGNLPQGQWHILLS